MKKIGKILIVFTLLCLSATTLQAEEEACITCHRNISPEQVRDWEASLKQVVALGVIREKPDEPAEETVLADAKPVRPAATTEPTKRPASRVDPATAAAEEDAA